MFIDFHSHILPEIDDGSRNIENSILMLKQAINNGIDCIVTTPHFYADESSIERFLQARNMAYDKLLEKIEQEKDSIYRDDVVSGCPVLIKGAEIAFFSGISESARIDELATGRVVMIEMPFRQWRYSDVDEISALIDRGFTVVIAHIERYLRRENGIFIDRLLELPVICQVNGEAIIERSESGRTQSLLDINHGRQSRFRAFLPGKTEDVIFRSGIRYVLGSDTHGLHRRPQNLAHARTILEKLSPELLQSIDGNSEQLLKEMLLD